MITNTRTAYIPVEVFSRELDSKVCLAVYLKSKGFQVVFGHIWYTNTVALKHAKSNDIYFGIHAKREFGDEILEKLKNRGVILIGIEEEGPFDFENFEEQDAERGTSTGIYIYDKWLCWGDRDFGYLAKIFPESQLINIGTPRSILWSEQGEKYFTNALLDLKYNRFGKYILITTSFWRSFAVNDKKLIFDLTKNYGEQYAKNLSLAYNESSDFRDEVMFNKIKAVVEYLIKNTKFNVVIRPYPMETNHVARTLQESCKKRIFIDRSDSVTPLLSSAVALIHTTSTTAFESIVRGIPTISLSEYNFSNNFDKFEFSVKVSHRPKNNTQLEESFYKSNDSNLNKVITINNPMVFFDKLYGEIQSINVSSTNTHRNLITRNKSRYIYSAISSIKKGKVYTLDFTKRPKIGLKKIRSKINDAQILLGLGNLNISVSKLDRDTYYLT